MDVRVIGGDRDGSLTKDIGVVQWDEGRVVGTHGGQAEGEAELCQNVNEGL